MAMAPVQLVSWTVVQEVIIHSRANASSPHLGKLWPRDIVRGVEEDGGTWVRLHDRQGFVRIRRGPDNSLNLMRPNRFNMLRNNNLFNMLRNNIGNRWLRHQVIKILLLGVGIWAASKIASAMKRLQKSLMGA